MLARLDFRAWVPLQAIRLGFQPQSDSCFVSARIMPLVMPIEIKATFCGFWSPCPASSILSGQRQLEFPILFERYQQQSGLWEKWESRGFCGISKGGGKGGKPAFGFPRFPPP